jgi:hypothetical protein
VVIAVAILVAGILGKEVGKIAPAFAAAGGIAIALIYALFASGTAFSVRARRYQKFCDSLNYENICSRLEGAEAVEDCQRWAISEKQRKRILFEALSDRLRP